MNQGTFFENFELLADAPNGVQKLRELILLLAVQGKLVPQDPNDEPASVLLEQITAEKEILVREKKIKRSRALPSIDLQKIPYEIPYNWEWVRLGDVGHDCGQKKPDKIFSYIDVSAINKEQGIISDDVDILEPSEAPSRARKLVLKESVIYATVRPYLLNIAIIDKQFEPEPIVSTAFAVLHPYSGILNKYLYYYLRSRPFITYVESEMIGMAYPAINDGKLYMGLVPIPPFEEQKRIVSKVDQLMALCDQLEARQQKKHEKRILLNNAALDKLLTAPTPEEFAQHWQRVCDNFDLLYNAPETVGQLQQAILQLAVQGKLVAQNPGDEPAAVLLEEIKNEKERLVNDKKISKIKSLPPIKENEISYELPKKWIWTRLGEALIKITDGTHHSPPNGPKGEFKYITAKNIKSKGINLSNITYVSKTVHEEIYSRCNPEPGNILYIKDGATTGIVTINDLNEQFSMLSSVALLKNPSKIYNRYLLYVLRSPYFYSLMRDDMSGVAITRVTLTKLNRALIPLAPFEEQKSIVAKVDQLMALCEELEAGLVQAQTDGGKLMEAVVHHVLAG